MKKVTILLTKYSDWISTFVYHIAGRGYTHASLGLEDEPGVYYSFNYRGFCTETLEKHRRRGVEQSLSCELSVSEEAYEKLRQQVAAFQAHRAEFRYTRLGVACCILHLPLRWKGHYFCSQFVADLLQKADAVPLKKRAELYLPNQFWAELSTSRQLLRVVQNPV